MSHVNQEPEYYLARCTGSDHEKMEADEFHRQGRPCDRDIVVEGLRRADADSDLIALVESGADVSWPIREGSDYDKIMKVLRAAG